MATFRKVPRKKGHAWKAIIRRKGLKQISRVFTRKTDARKWAERIEANRELCQALGNPKAAGVKVRDVIKKYRHQHTGKDGDRKRHLGYWEQRIGDVKITEVTPDLMMDERALLLDEPGKRCGKNRPRSGATVNRYMSAISSVFNFAIKQWIMPPKSNPCVGLPRGTEVSRFGRALSDAERIALLEACKQSEWHLLYLLVLLALSTGARKSEMLSLRWSDLNFSDGTALVLHTKNGQPRVLILLEPVLQELKRLPRPLNSTTKLFPRETDPYQSITDQEFYPYWNAAKAAAGITNFRFHDVRHSSATIMVQAGLSLAVVAETLGHQTLSMVKRYSHVAITSQRNELENALRGKLG